MQDLLGMVSGPAQAASGKGGKDTNAELLAQLIPAGLAFMQSKAAGADTKSAALEAAMRAFTGSSPLQSTSPRAASSGLIAQAILKALSSQ